MARTLSVVAQQPLFKSIIIAAVAWLFNAPRVSAEESVRVTTTQPQVIQNPFSRRGAPPADSAAATKSTLTVMPATPAGSSPAPTVAPPQRLPESSISVLPPGGPKTYQNPFTDPLATAPSNGMPLLPGPISRWRRSVPVQQDESNLKSAIMATDLEPASAIATTNDLQRRGMRWDRLPPAEELRELHAKNANSTSASRTNRPLEPIRFGPTNLTQPDSVVPNGEVNAATTSAKPAQDRQREFDPFELSTPAAANEPASFVAPDDANEGSLQSTVPVEPDTAQVIVSDEGDVTPGSLARAEELAKTAETPEALTAVADECRRAIDSEPQAKDVVALRRLAAWAYNRRGELAVESGNEHDALRDFQSAIELDSECWLALHNRGVTLAQQNKLQPALADFNRVIELNPGLVVAYRNRGELLAALDRMAEAVRDYDRAIDQAPEDASLYFARGYAYHRLGKYDRALADLNLSLQLAPDEAVAYTQRGNIHAERGDFTAAVADLEKAIELDAQQPEAYRSLAWLRATCPDSRHRDAEQALAAAQQAIELAGTNHSFLLEALAAAHASAGQFQEATRIQQQALSAASPSVSKPLEERLAMYQQRKAFRSGPRPAVQTASHEFSSEPRPNQRGRTSR